MRTAALSALLLAAGAARAAPPDVPAALKCEPGQLVRVVAKGEKVGYLRNFADDAAFFDELAPAPGERRFVFQATRPGTYVLGFFTVGEDKGVACTVTVGAPAPPAPPPVPPNDPLRSKVKTALDADKAAKEDVLQLAELYRQAVGLAGDPAVSSSAALLSAMRKAGEHIFAGRPDVLVSVRRAVAGELAAALGKSNDDPLTDPERKRAADLFGRLALVLEDLAK